MFNSPVHLMSDMVKTLKEEYPFLTEYKKVVVPSSRFYSVMFEKLKDQPESLVKKIILFEPNGELDEHDGSVILVNEKYGIALCSFFSTDYSRYRFLFGKEEKNITKMYEMFWDESRLRKGVYEVESGIFGKSLQKVTFNSVETPVFKDDLVDKLYNMIEGFFKLSDELSEYNIPKKRGILLFGPPGTGKTLTIKNLINRLDKTNKYVCLIIKDVGALSSVKEIISDLDKGSKVVFVYEDVETAMVERSLFLNFMDGLGSIENSVFIATTNYPEKLDKAVLDRPGRFDVVIEVGLPDKEHRKLLIKHYFCDRWFVFNKPKEITDGEEPVTLTQESVTDKHKILTEADIEKAADLTEGFNCAYFKEMFIYSLLNNVSIFDAIKHFKKYRETHIEEPPTDDVDYFQ